MGFSLTHVSFGRKPRIKKNRSHFKNDGHENLKKIIC